MCWGKLPPAVFLGGLWGYGGPEEVVGPMRLRVGGNVGAKGAGEGKLEERLGSAGSHRVGCWGARTWGPCSG